MKKTSNKKGLKISPKKSTKAGIKLVPLSNRVLIKPFTKEELMTRNRFGIILPEAGSKEKSEQGTVLAVGPGEYRDGKLMPVSVKIGDRVAFSKYGYEEINIGGEDMFLIKEENILAILK